MKLFGEYLVEKGLISKDLLADALVEQVSTMPSYVELAWKAKVLGSDEILRVLKLQNEKRVGFVEALRELGLYTASVEQTLTKSGNAARTPLGEILVKRGVVSLEMIAHSLDEYLGEIKGAPAAGGHRALPPASAAEKTPAPAPAAAPAAGPGQGSGSAEVFLETFSTGARGRLQELAELFMSGNGGGREQVKEIFDEVHRVRGSLRLAGLAKSEEFCAAFEGDLQMVLGLQTLPSDLLKNLGRTAKVLCEVLWAVREAVAGGGGEGAFLGQDGAKEKVESLVSYIEILKFNAEMAG